MISGRVIDAALIDPVETGTEQGVTETDARTHADVEALAGIGVRFEHRGYGLLEDHQAETSPEGSPAEDNGI